MVAFKVADRVRSLPAIRLEIYFTLEPSIQKTAVTGPVLRQTTA